MSVNDSNDNYYPQVEKIKTRSWLLFFILFVLIFGFFVFYFSEIKKEIKLLEKVKVFWLVIAIFFQFLTYLFTAVVYRLLLSVQSLEHLPKLLEVLKATVVSFFFNQTMPSAGISGNTFFLSFLAKLKVTMPIIITIILAELLIFYVAMEFMIITLLMLSLFCFKVPHSFTITLVAGVVIYLVFGILIALAGRKKAIEYFYGKVLKSKFLKRVFRNVFGKIQENVIFGHDIHVLDIFRNNNKAIVKSFLAQILVVISDGFTLWALFYGLGMSVSPLVVLLCLVSTKVISIIPFLPGALILYESSMTFFFVSLGVPLGTAIIVTLIYRLLSFWVPIPIGLFLYRQWLKKNSATVNSP